MGAGGRRQDHYEVLGVSPEAPEEVVRAAYRALAAKYHPDRNPTDGGAELRLKRLNAAFAVIGDSEKRRQYDELTRSPEATEPRDAPNKERTVQEESGPAPKWKTPGESSTIGDPPRPAKAAKGKRFRSGALIAAIFYGSIFAWISARKGVAPKAATSSTHGSVATTAPAENPWVWVTQADYKIAFPGTPQREPTSTTTTGVGVATLTAINLSLSNAFYSAAQIDYAPGSTLNEQGAIDGALNGFGSTIHETPKLLTDRRVMIGNCNGRSFSATVKGYTVRSLLCVSGSHSYAAMATFPSTAGADAVSEAESFLGSFSINAPSIYVVVAGDSLYGIAAAHNMTLAELLQANGAQDSNVQINPGDVLRLR